MDINFKILQSKYFNDYQFIPSTILFVAAVSEYLRTQQSFDITRNKESKKVDQFKNWHPRSSLKYD